ncbi:hypothetical protein V3C99_017002 [Haemonchus contortus]
MNPCRQAFIRIDTIRKAAIVNPSSSTERQLELPQVSPFYRFTSPTVCYGVETQEEKDKEGNHLGSGVASLFDYRRGVQRSNQKKSKPIDFPFKRKRW